MIETGESMSLPAAFLIFTVLMGISLAAGVTMLLPLGAGFILFTLAALHKGHSLKKVLRLALESLKESFIVVGILLIIGCLTGMWRQCGTVSYLMTAGISLIPQRFFILACFLLSSFMSFALGTSFGVTATAGVILMSIARAGGVNPYLAAGAVLSGVYVGDRGSPAASSANLVAVLTHTDMRKNVREMLKCALVPFAVCTAAYTLISFTAPMQEVSSGILEELKSEFGAHWSMLIPAVLMILLPFFGLKIRLSMAVSLLAAFITALLCGNGTAADCIRSMFSGYQAKDPALSGMISGGGIVSMLEVCGILIISCSYGTIFQGTGLLKEINGKLRTLSGKAGRFPVMILLSLAACAVFCNQTIGAIIVSNLSAELYTDEEKTRKMLDMENSVIVIAGLVPWCIACSVPRSMLGVGAGCIPFCFYLFLIPLWWLIAGKNRPLEG